MAEIWPISNRPYGITLAASSNVSISTQVLISSPPNSINGWTTLSLARLRPECLNSSHVELTLSLESWPILEQPLSGSTSRRQSVLLSKKWMSSLAARHCSSWFWENGSYQCRDWTWPSSPGWNNWKYCLRKSCLQSEWQDLERLDSPTYFQLLKASGSLVWLLSGTSLWPNICMYNVL